MASSNVNHRANWAQFEVYNDDPQTNFEHMSRSLFNRMFFENKAIFHINSNNPGIEIEPVFSNDQKALISFQAKYFSPVIDYTQIDHSADMVIKYYSEKIDTLYLFCNKTINTHSKAYKRIEQKLADAHIKVVPITDQMILDQVEKFPEIGLLYFNNHGLKESWFHQQVQTSLTSMGQKYNNRFNIDTRIENCVDIFCQNADGVALLNKKKTDALNELDQKRWILRDYSRYLRRAQEAILILPDIQKNTMLECLKWSELVNSALKEDITVLKELLSKKEERLSKEKDRTLQEKIEEDIDNIRYLLGVSDLLEISSTEEQLLRRKVLIIEGDAGVGKSQLFAVEALKIINTGNTAILLLGNTFLSDDPIVQQIVNGLELDYNFDKMLTVLEGIGERKQSIVVILIDAINETYNKEVWKTAIIPLAERISSLRYVRLALSVRSGYENLMFNDATKQKIRDGDIAKLCHTGFQDESIEATRIFLDSYHIPFSPSSVLQYEMGNPLFLTLFCQVYDGEEIDIFTVFNRVIENADAEIQNQLRLGNSASILKELINEIAEYQLANSRSSISKVSLFELKFWTTYGLNACKIPFMAAAVRTGVISNFAQDESEWYTLGFDLLADFACAKSLILKYPNADELKSYLQNNYFVDAANIDQKKIDIFIVLNSLFAEKFGEECIDILLDLVVDEALRNFICKQYVESYVWRKSRTIKRDTFFDIINGHRIDSRTVFRVFIENSTKSTHPLNALALHKVLLQFPLNLRDHNWTEYINHCSRNYDRLFQLIEYIAKDQKLGGLKESNLWLLLLLLAWILTSSNRLLRDMTSKAIIELLKDNFELAKPLLAEFVNINDPYVIQRLYGVVFGACMKRSRKGKQEFDDLAIFVYRSVFCKRKVYPDILLRDYAKLIIERWLYEFPESRQKINYNRIIPPYQSDEIPMASQEEYYIHDTKSRGYNKIDMSMRPNCNDCPGMYGDFGRYVFQSALHDFRSIEISNLYHYAMQFIRDTLGYSNELFSDYDSFVENFNYDRHQGKKIERIGKKYQWIAFYNILARVSDHNSMENWEKEMVPYEGPWDPYVRDFDPTRNEYLLNPTEIPTFADETKANEFMNTPVEDKQEIATWVGFDCGFFLTHSTKLAFKDAEEHTWIRLNQYEEVNNECLLRERESIYYSEGSQRIWSMSFAYFVKKDEFETFKRELANKDFSGIRPPEAIDVYQLFCREFTWAPGYQSIIGDDWRDYEVETGEKTVVKHHGIVPKIIPPAVIDDIDGQDETESNINSNELDSYREIIATNKYSSSEDEFEFPSELEFEEKDWEEVIAEKRVLGRLLPAYIRVLWEEEYDASQETATSFDIPCKEVIDQLDLDQHSKEGFFYSKDKTLVAFDSKLVNQGTGLVIRKDSLDLFLKEKDYRLIWACIGEKQYFHGSSGQTWGKWSGLFYYDNECIEGTMKHRPERDAFGLANGTLKDRIK